MLSSHGGSSTGSGPPRRGYNRVPTSGSNMDDDNITSPGSFIGDIDNHQRTLSVATVSVADHNSNHGDDTMQQSLLYGEDDPHAVPETPNGSEAPQPPAGAYWRSPPQLHCVLASVMETWNIIFPRIRPLGNFLFGITLLTMLIFVPMVTYNAIKDQHRYDHAAFDSSGIMVLGTLVLSFRLVYLHLSHWYMPEVQKYVVRIVWMVPLYAVQSWLSLVYRDARIYINAIRDLYEAFVIASFLYYLMELLGGQDALVRTLESKQATHPNLGKHSWPLNHVLHDWQLGTEFMLQCKHGVLQYVVVKTVATVLTYLFETADCYGEGEFHWNSAYPYMAFMLNTSVMYALYALVMLFHAVHEELQHPINWRPLGKFLCVKGVVFFTWWQGVIIFFLQARGFIKDTGSWSGDEIANAVIDYCICFEMVFFAVAHSYTFSYKEYLPSSIPPELRNLTVNANINAHHGPQPLRLEPTRRPSSESLQSSTVIATGGGSHIAGSQVVNATYRPPAVLDQPLNFREAFWSSSIPRETIADIQRLRNGVKGELPSGMISLSEIQTEAEAAAANAAAAGDTAQAAAIAEVAAAASEAAQRVADDDMDVEQQSGNGSVGST